MGSYIAASICKRMQDLRGQKKASLNGEAFLFGWRSLVNGDVNGKFIILRDFLN